MNKHREAIEALKPFAKLFEKIEHLSYSMSCPVDGDATYTVTLKGKDLLEVSRIVKEWETKHTKPKSDTRPRCKTCGTRNYYQNLNSEGRCPFCEDELRHFLLFGEIEKIEKKGKKKAKKITDTRKEMATELRKMGDEELESFLKSVPTENAVLYRGILRKY